jgi:hypothetical protein
MEVSKADAEAIAMVPKIMSRPPAAMEPPIM